MEEEEFGYDAQPMADTDVCVWCNGDGCDACAGHDADAAPNAADEEGDCPWCGGEGCESCQQPAAVPGSPHPGTPTALTGRSPSFAGATSPGAPACTCGLGDHEAARAAHRCGGYAWPPDRVYNGDSDDDGDALPASAFDKDDDSDYDPEDAADAPTTHDPMCAAFVLDASAVDAGADADADASMATTPRRPSAAGRGGALTPVEAKSQSASLANSPAFGSSASPYGLHGGSGSLAAIAAAAGASAWAPGARAAAEAERFHDVSVHGLVAPGSRPRARTPAQAYELMQRGAESLSKVLFTSANDADVLLRAYSWDAPHLVAQWIDRTPAAVRAETGACDPRGRAEAERRYSIHTDSQGKEDTLVTCCMPYCDTVAKRATEQLACGHAMCTEHWVQFVSQELRSGPTVIRARCPGYCCTDSNCLHKKPACRCRQLIPQHIIHKYLRRAVREADDERTRRFAQRVAAASPAVRLLLTGARLPGETGGDAGAGAGAGGSATTFTAPGAVAVTASRTSDSDSNSGKRGTGKGNGKSKGGGKGGDAAEETTGWVDEHPDLCPRNAVSQYELFQLRAMVEWSPHHQFCSNPRCDRAIERPNGSALANFKCECGTVSCLLCGRDGGHLPCPCDLAEKFHRLTDSDAASLALIDATSKKCPKCLTNITKDKYCNHMNCVKCGHQFCWLCKGDWSKHGGDYYSCNAFNSDKLDAKAKTEAATKDARNRSMQKLYFFSSRFEAHGKDYELTLNSFERALKSGLSHESRDQSLVINAFEAILDARRFLQWSFAFAYFLKDGGRKLLFEAHQHRLGVEAELVAQHLRDKGGDFAALTEDPQTRELLLRSSQSLRSFTKAVASSIIDDDLTTFIDYDTGHDATTGWSCTLCRHVHNIANSASNVLSISLAEALTSANERAIARAIAGDVGGVQAITAAQRRQQQQADAGVAAGQMAVTAAVRAVDGGQMYEFCAKCAACRLHSDVDCRACVRRC